MLQDLLNGLVAQTEAPGGALGSLIPFALIFGVMYFLIIRPQQKQQKTQQQFISQLKKGDEVVLQSGIFGKVHSVDETVVTLEIAKDVKVRVLKGTVTGAAPTPKAPEAKSEAEKKS